jgi:hypothetical protein
LGTATSIDSRNSESCTNSPFCTTSTSDRTDRFPLIRNEKWQDAIHLCYGHLFAAHLLQRAFREIIIIKLVLCHGIDGGHFLYQVSGIERLKHELENHLVQNLCYLTQAPLEIVTPLIPLPTTLDSPGQVFLLRNIVYSSVLRYFRVVIVEEAS